MEKMKSNLPCPPRPKYRGANCEAVAILREAIASEINRLRRDSAIGVIVSFIALILAICSAIGKIV